MEMNNEWVQDPKVFNINREKAHASIHRYASLEEMHTNKSSYIYSLNGKWKFHYANGFNQLIKDFSNKDYNSDNWDEINVPGHIQLQGYGTPMYVNQIYPWSATEQIIPGEIPEHNPIGSYITYFDSSVIKDNTDVYINFKGVESAMALWVNGTFVGYSEDTFTPSRFNITSLIEEGKNKIAVNVYRFSSGSWLEDQDFWRFSGIFRDVELEMVPHTHLEDIKVLTHLNDTYDHAVVEVNPTVIHPTKVIYTLKYNDEIIVSETKEDSSSLQFELEHPYLWSAEKPHLYTLIIEVMDEEGLVECISQQVGIREFEIINGIMCINGQRIIFHGVNRHEFSAYTGRHVSYEETKQDILNMKAHNINALRTSHYPNQSFVYDLCDEYGLYVIDEVNLETHGTWSEYFDKEHIIPDNKPEWLDIILDRANSMYERDKNHPSIIIWSLGNESHGGKNLYEMSQFLRNKDQSRVIHYEGISHDRSYNETSDIESQMYTYAKDIEKYLTTHQDKPFILCEYAHSMGNSNGALFKYIDLEKKYPLYQGGFIWDYIDQSIYKKDRYGKEFQAYGGDFGDRPTDYNFSGNGIAYGGNRDASPKMQEVKFNYQNITAEVSEESVLIKNKNLFINTDKFDCKVTVAKNGKLIRTATMDTAVDPLCEKKYELPFEKESRPGEYTITVSFHLKEQTIWAEAGHEIAFGQYVYNVEGVKEICTDEIQVIHSTHNIGVRGAHFEVLFSVLNGGLVSYKYAGREMIEAIPKPNFWRAPTDNDCGNQMPMRYAQWKIASMYLGHKEYRKGEYGPMNFPEVEEGKNTIKISYTYFMPTTPASECRLSYEVFADGRIKTTLSYDPVEGFGDMPEFGVLFKLNADYDRVEWYGLGEAETYADRKHGAKLGIYQNKVIDNMAQYMVPQECGAKEEVRWAKVVDRKGRGMLFEMDEVNGPMMFSALPYTPHEIENAMHPYELPEIHYTVVRAAKGQMGIGGDDSWGSYTHPEYLLNKEGKMEFSFTFKGI